MHLQLGPRSNTGDVDARIREFIELVNSGGLESARVLTGQRREPHPRWFVGQGKLDELKDVLAEEEADLVIVNHDLTASQLRNLEQAVDCRVITRTELILLIFADRARTFEGMLQVELAQLRHAQTRVTRGWTHLDRQKGGVGMRGAGETQQEMDHRILAGRVKKLESRLADVQKRRSRNRRRRRRQQVATVALVGYTNAGKSTLFNRLTDAQVLSEDRMFATLDPTLRAWPLPFAGEVVLADTVGFIRDLPVGLVDAFRATLEEVIEANLLLLVVDASDDQCDMQVSEVRRTLKDIGAQDVPILLTLNKTDMLNGEASLATLVGSGEAAEVAFLDVESVSAKTGAGLEALAERVGRLLSAEHQELDVLLPPEAGKTRSWLYGLGAVVTEEVRENGSVALRLKAEPALVARIERLPEVIVTSWAHPQMPS